MSAIHELFDVSKRRRDPTGTTSLQVKFFGEAGTRMARAKLTIRRAVIENDLLGLADGPMRHHAPAVRLQAFGHMVENAVAGMRGVWPQRFLQRAWAMGLDAAAREGFAGSLGEEELSTLSQEVQHELVGIVAATVQRVTRAGASVGRGARPTIAARRILSEFDKVAFNRVQALVAYFVVKTYNRAKLEAYRAGGLARVGIEPELRRARVVRDADLVGVLTAGDDLVCQECEDYADDSPYEIDDVELPLHPRCRCAVFPWEDKRFAGAGGAEIGDAFDGQSAVSR